MRAMRATVLPASPAQRTATRSTLRVLAVPGVLALAMVALLMTVPPVGEFPIDDDWLYARTVQSLLEQGRLELPVWAANSLVLQVYWGALFSRFLGFSHEVLRLSTLVLGAAGVLACYLLLRELLDDRRALLGALLLLFNPLYVFLSYSFMTDVPFLSLALWSLFCSVRALRGPRPSVAWLAAGSVLAGGAYLVRQVGVLLPMAALGGLLLTVGWRTSLSPRFAAAVLGPMLPALLLGAYFDNQRGPIREDPLGWTLAFWVDQSPGLIPLLLARLAGACSTLGLLTLPASVGILLGQPSFALTGRRRALAAGLLLALALGFIALVYLPRVDYATYRLLFPHLGNVLTERGFEARTLHQSSPASITIPPPALVLITLAGILAGGLLVLAWVSALSRERMRGRLSVPLLFGLLVFIASLLYAQFYDRYLLTIFPSSLLVVFLACPDPGLAVAGRSSGVRARLGRSAGTLALAGVALFAAWSVWWEREYLERRAALWQAGQTLVERGIPPEQIEGGREWNGWYLGPSVIAAAVQQARLEGDGQALNAYVRRGLDQREAPWVLAYRAPARTAADRIAVSIPYGRGQQVVALQRF
jgi:4-amino-4-deoxy-L-arabinose transferase-like glycosyltransferase